MKQVENFIVRKLLEKKESNSYRFLKPENNLIDFCSNDYLGFSRSEDLKRLIENELLKYPDYKLGSTGSRLLAGNNSFTENLEKEIAEFHSSESALIYNSGYDANVGLFSCIAQKGDSVISDELIHASVIDGMRLNYANRFVFKHNDLENLEQKLKHSKTIGGNVFIVVESVYSMDGDFAPLVEICNLAEKYKAAFIVDEAHATGCFGEQGRGLVTHLKLENRVFARIITFSKGLGNHGAAVCGSETLRSYLINFSRSFIYSTAANFHTHLTTQMAYKFLQSEDHQSPLRERISFFKMQMKDIKQLIKSDSAIQALVISGNAEAKELAANLQTSGFDVRAILSPTVKNGSERLRICLHNHNTFSEISDLTNAIKKFISYE
ncbi:MAG: pyridoxal phosphate-dependent aminotransferase family protein [Daejeonella sp.]